MKTLWYIAKKDLLQVLKDRNSFILLLLVPLALIVVVGYALGSFTGGSNQIAITVAINNQDNGFVGSAIVNALKINTSQLAITVQLYNDPAQVTKLVADTSSNVNAGVVIPAGTTDKLGTAASNGSSTQNLVQFYAVPSNNDARITITKNIVTNMVDQLVNSQFASASAVKQVYSVCNQSGNHCAPNTIDPAVIARAVGEASANAARSAQVEALTAGNALKVNNFDLAVPGYAVFFALFGLNSAAATILQEKEDGTFRRLLIAPIQKYALLGGKLLAQFLLTLLQLAVLFVIGYFAFHLDIGSWPAVIALLIGTSFAATGLGILLVSVVKTRRQLSPLITLVVLLTSAIGGAWWPLWIEPAWMQQMAKIGLTAWAMEGLNGVMIFSKDFVGVLPDILGLLGYGLICFIIAMRFFRFQERAA